MNASARFRNAALEAAATLSSGHLAALADMLESWVAEEMRNLTASRGSPTMPLISDALPENRRCQNKKRGRQ